MVRLGFVRCSYGSEFLRLLWKISGPNPLKVVKSTHPSFTKQVPSDVGLLFFMILLWLPFTFAHKHSQARTKVMSLPLTENNAYYSLSSDHYGPSFQLSDGPFNDPPGTLSVALNRDESNNWQIFYQDPIYLIRNYIYGTKYQLGIAEDSPTVPALLLASGDLTQQWNMTLWDDATFRLANMWLGNEQVLGIGGKDDTPIPVMTAAQNGTHWSFVINLSNLTSNLPDDMLQSVSLQAVRWNLDFVCLLLVDANSLSQAPSSTSTSTPLSTLASTTIFSTPAETAVATTTITAGSVSSSSSSASSQSTTSRFISGGAIAGIIVAIVALALVVLGLLFFVWRRRRQQRHGLPADQPALAQQQEENWYPAMHNVDTRHPLSEMGVSNEKERMRSPAVEMPG